MSGSAAGDMKLEVIEDDEREAADATPDEIEPTKTYLLETKNGSQRKLTVPASWKVTFGPTVPFERKGAGGYRGDDGTWALRLYEKGDKLRAIFTDVKAFRDMDIQVLERRTRTKRQVVEKASHKGGKSVEVEAKISSWVDPDNEESDSVPEELLKLDYQHKDEDIEF